jgi:hypothetical protein
VPGASLATVTGILKEVYDGKLREQLNSEVVLLKRIQRNGGGSTISTNVGGKYTVFPIHVGRNTGMGGRRENENLPLAGNQATAPAQVRLKYLYGSVMITGQTLRLASKDPQTFVAGIDLEMNGIKTDLSKDLNRQVFGDGTGAIATTSTAGASPTSLTITSGIQWLQVGELVDVYTPATLAADSAPKSGSPVTVTGVDQAAGTATLAANSVTTAAGDVLVRTGSANREWTGLKAIVNNTGTLYAIDPVAYPIWKSVVDANAGTNRPLSESAMIRNVHAVRTNGGKVSLLVSSLGVQRAYWNLLVQARRFSNVKTFDGGYSGLTFTTDAGEVPMVADIDSPPNLIYGITEENIRQYRDSDWDWMDYDGSMWDRVPGSVAGTIKDAYAATLFQYSELGTDRRNAHFVMKDITES